MLYLKTLEKELNTIKNIELLVKIEDKVIQALLSKNQQMKRTNED